MSDVMNVSNLDKKNARVAISRPLEDTAWRFSDGLVSAIVQDTDNYSYFTQFFCGEIISRVDRECCPGRLREDQRSADRRSRPRFF